MYADETGLREDGTNSSLWSFSIARERYFVHGRRTKELVDEVPMTPPRCANSSASVPWTATDARRHRELHSVAFSVRAMAARHQPRPELHRH
jgi:hypothetical protein